MFETTSGLPLPMGVTVLEGGVNFSIFSKNATFVQLVIYEKEDSEFPLFSVDLDPVQNKTGEVWHCLIKELKETYWYGYFMDGPYDPNAGHRFNMNKLLIDPYAKAISIIHPLSRPEHFGFEQKNIMGDLSFSKLKSEKIAPKACIVKEQGFQGKKSTDTKFKDHIIYEMHVKGFTMNPNSLVEHKGSFRGIVEKIPYLKELGITAVELMPIHCFDDKNILRHDNNGKSLKNYWGYDPIAFFALHTNYASDKSVIGAIDEFKYMVDELHKADIQVFLDVVFNHSGEGNENGPTVSFRGIDNSIYYILENGRYYKNYTGCGNTMNCNNPVVKDLIVDCLLHWVIEMGVDGFRFDLASILARDSDGSLLRKAPIVERIAEHPVLKDVIIIAEAWDAAGAYQVGEFGGVRWAEWNGKYRDDIRSFLKSDKGSLASMMERITGSPSMFLSSSKPPESSINFITCHDGFTLYDLFSYNEKHNIANGEDNRDGYNDNRSWNCGIEGATLDENILRLRFQLMKNAMSLMMISLGVPMITSGDEFGKTQHGNNNVYCQDNEVSWLDWSLYEKNKDFFRFVKNIINFRKNNPALRRPHFYRVPEGCNKNELCDLTWYGEQGKNPEWRHNSLHVAFMIKGDTPKEEKLLKQKHDDIFVIANSHWEEHSYLLPRLHNKYWYYVSDTSKSSPEDIVEFGHEILLIDQNKYVAAPRSIVILVAKDYKHLKE